MPIYKKTDGSLVIAASNPGGGAVLVTVNTSDPLSVNAPLLRGLDSSNTTIFHPGNYYSGDAEQSHSLVINRSDGEELMRVDESGVYGTISTQTCRKFGGTYFMPILQAFDMYFLGCTTNELSSTSCTYTPGSYTITLSGTITGTPVLGMPVYINNWTSTNSIGAGQFLALKKGGCVIPRIIAIVGSTLTLSERLLPSGEPAYTGPVSTSQFTPFSGYHVNNTIKAEVGTFSIKAGEYIFGQGVPPGTFAIETVVNSTTVKVSKVGSATRLQSFPMYPPIKGTGSITKRVRILYPILNGESYSEFTRGCGLTLDSTGYTRTLDDATNSDFNRSQEVGATYLNVATNTVASLGFTANANPSDTTDATNFPASKVGMVFDTAGTLPDVLGNAYAATTLVELTNRTSTGTILSNIYSTYYSVVISGTLNNLFNSVT